MNINEKVNRLYEICDEIVKNAQEVDNLYAEGIMISGELIKWCEDNGKPEIAAAMREKLEEVFKVLNRSQH